MNVFKSPAATLRALASTLVLALSACGGGVETGGTGAYVQGPVVGFGSVIVAGVRFDDSRASIEDPDGSVRRREDLRLGMQVEVESGPIGDDGSGGRVATATRVRLASELLGPVGLIDDANSRLFVLGQLVRLTSATVIDGVPGGALGLRIDDVVEVHGFFAPVVGYVATRVERRAAAPASYRVRGLVRDLDAVARTLRVGLQVFDLSVVGVPPGLTNEQFVRLSLQTSQVGSRWRATAIAVEARGAGDRDEAEVEGLVSAFTSAALFSVNGVRIDASGATHVDGSAGLAEGVRVKVRGRSQAGLLIAATVDIRSDDDALLEGVDLRGAVGSVDAAAQTFTLLGNVVFYGGTQPAPRFEGGDASHLAAGRQVRVRGIVGPDRTRVVATRIEFVNN